MRERIKDLRLRALREALEEIVGGVNGHMDNDYRLGQIAEAALHDDDVRQSCEEGHPDA